MSHDRRQFLTYFSSIGLGSTLFPGVLYSNVAEGEPITVETIEAAERIAGISFTAEHREMMVEDLNSRLDRFEELRDMQIPNDVPPALQFDPTIGGVHPDPAGAPVFVERVVDLPTDPEDLAFLSVAELSSLIRRRELSCVEATRFFLDRLRRYDGVLEAVITYTDDRALAQARLLDEELDRGVWRGPLHGIPYGAKDLLAVKGYPTTWGAAPYRDQSFDYDAAVVEKLDAAGAVLLAKLSVGALAWGDVWFGGTTKNPWNIEQGSSGSSAGSGATVSAGLLPFALGTETLGSIVSPANRNGITGHRPTYGLVSRYGAMSLTWSMDKIGPMARSAEDCALVFDAIRGADPRDTFSRDAGFVFDPEMDVSTLRVGFLADAFAADYANQGADQRSLDVLRSLGVELVPVTLPDDMPLSAMMMTLDVEAAAAFDDLTRSGRDSLMVRQTKNAWPHVFRTARTMPAVEFLQAARARTQLARETTSQFADFDVIITPTYGGGSLSVTNLTGHPSVTLPNDFAAVAGSSERREPRSITFLGSLYDDGKLLSLAHAYQQETDHHRRRPPIR